MDRELKRNESVSEAVVDVVSRSENCEPTSLPPLTDAVDPDALNHLFHSRSGGVGSRTGHISFVYSDSHVSIDHNEYITAEPIVDFSSTS
jgi:hypothetical protein